MSDFETTDTGGDELSAEAIESDEDNAEDYLGEGGSLYPYPEDVDLEEIGVDLQEEKVSVYELVRKFDQGKIKANPEFQRNLVWTQEKKSSFVESIILNIPLPPMYFNQDKQGRWIVVDGLQRSTTLRDFVKNRFELKGMKALPWLNGKKFGDLGDIQARIEDKGLLYYLIKPSVPLSVIYDIFNRINTGGTQLQRQEIRNCIFQGLSTELLKSLSERVEFRRAIDDGIKSTRMKDREAVLRCIAFRIRTPTEYRGDMDDFLGTTMANINLMSEAEIGELSSEFLKVMSLVRDVFGRKAFRIPTAHSRGLVNIAVMESVYGFLASAVDMLEKTSYEKLQDNYENLIRDPEYLDSVKTATGSSRKVKARFDMANEVLRRGIC